MADLTALVETVAAAEWERQKGSPWVDLEPMVQHAAREAILPLVTATAAAMRETLAAEREAFRQRVLDAEAKVARVEALADLWDEVADKWPYAHWHDSQKANAKSLRAALAASDAPDVSGRPDAPHGPGDGESGAVEGANGDE